jgi:hypothetical protein
VLLNLSDVEVRIKHTLLEASRASWLEDKQDRIQNNQTGEQLNVFDPNNILGFGIATACTCTTCPAIAIAAA